MAILSAVGLQIVLVFFFINHVVGRVRQQFEQVLRFMWSEKAAHSVSEHEVAHIPVALLGELFCFK